MRYLLPLLIFGSLLWSCESTAPKEHTTTDDNWIQLFNGKDLDDWAPKFNGYELGDNFNNTFRVEDGILKVSYEEYDSFRNEFGHLFYNKTAFSHYRLRAEYRSVGEHTKGGPGWAYANNGLMLHAQPIETMAIDQEFPISMECQLLAGKGDGSERTTGNLCTPGCHVAINDTLFTPHCTNSSSKTYQHEEWTTIEVVVLGDSIIHHIVEGDTVLTYSKPVMSEDVDTEIFVAGTPMTEGFIAIQAESHGFEFRKIELQNLCGCMDKTAVNYKNYYVEMLKDSCRYK